MDLSDQYNTQLSPEEEKAFQAWAAANGKLQDSYDYDIRGFFKNKEQLDERGHGTDRYKKPNHPTFSDESQYHGQGGLAGGHWTTDANGQTTFKPGPTNLEYYRPQDLQDYFQRNEPGIRLELPNGQ